MNLTKLGASSWIILLNSILLIILFIIIVSKPREYFINYPQQVNPSAAPKTTPEADTANNNYVSILMFIKQNPDKSAKFISDIKQRFFNEACEVKSDINFNNIAQMSNGLPF